MRIVTLDSNWVKQYEALCAGLEGLTIYSTWRYRCFIEALLGCEATYLGAVKENGELAAALPLMRQGGPLGDVLNSLPFFGSYGGLLGTNPVGRAMLIDNYKAILASDKTAAATIIDNPLCSLHENVPHDFTDSRIGQITSLVFDDEPETTLLGRIDGSARRNIKKAEQAGVEVEIDNNAWEALESIHRENMDAIGGRSKPAEFFGLLPRFLTADIDYRMFVARRGGRVVAALLVLYAGKVADYYIPATRLDERASQPSALLLLRGMLDAHARGYEIWNWGGTWTTQEGVLQFKRKWAAEERPYRYYTAVRAEAVLCASRERLLADYNHFYVLPFDRLKAGSPA